jgi:DNA-binding transcriptional ArsR family regulator
MEEKRYRESRLCRLLGNPIVYQIILYLDCGGALTPSKLAKLTRRKISTVSIHLAKLRVADVVRYETAGKETRYRLKNRAAIQGLIGMLGKVVDSSVRLK